MIIIRTELTAWSFKKNKHYAELQRKPLNGWMHVSATTVNLHSHSLTRNLIFGLSDLWDMGKKSTDIVVFLCTFGDRFTHFFLANIL